MPSTLTGNAGKILQVNAGGTGYQLKTEITTFAQLTDFPGAYASNASKIIGVNSGGTGL
jgi:hypothetical protein